jgi:hypothetical protein
MGKLDPLIDALTKLAQQLTTEAAPDSPPAAPEPARRPLFDHKPCLKADMSPCCSAHDAAFTERNRHITRGVIDLDVTRGRELDPDITPQMRAYIQHRLGDHRA